MQVAAGARKIPLLFGLTLLGSLIGWGSEPAIGQTADTARLRRDALRAESEYESGIRRFAPVSHSAPRSGPCDEIVGRYCIYYESGGDTLPPEPAAVTKARNRAISLLLRAHQAMPASMRIAFPLVRLLVEAGRAHEAVVVAGAFKSATPDSASVHMLLGFALHGAGRTNAAADAFAAWLTSIPEDRRDRIGSLEWLLAGKERSRYKQLSPEHRKAYEERVWRYADALYITPGNELWTDHVARHALAVMLSRRRSSLYVDSWGEDLEQLTVRFGPPALTTRSWRAGGLGSQEHYSEHWEPALRTYVAPVLADALGKEAPLDSIWPLDSLTARSGHVPSPLNTMHVLEHQASVFGNRLALTGRTRADTAQTASPRGAVFLLDSTLSIIGQAEAVATLDGDSLVFAADAPLPPNAFYYSAEIYDSAAHFGARARYRISRPASAPELAISSILLAHPFSPGALPSGRASPLLRPLTRPVLGSGSRLGVYAEVSGSGERRSIQVEMETNRLDRPGAIGRALGWIGGKVGLSTPRAPTRLGWSIELDPEKTNALPVTLDLGNAEPGRYRLTLTIHDPTRGATATAQRDLLIIKARN